MPHTKAKGNILRKLLKILLLQILATMLVLKLDSAYAKELKSAWSDFPPYSFKKGQNPVGVDIDISSSIVNATGNVISFEEMSWAKSLEKLEVGEIDILTGATFTENRAKFSFFSAPYRFEANSLVLKRYPRVTINFRTPTGFVSELQKTNFKLGTVEGYVYSEPVVADYVKRASLKKRSSSSELVQDMLNGAIDGFITDSNEARKIVGMFGDKLAEVPTGMKTPIRFMLSKKTMTKSDLDSINQSIQSLAQAGIYMDIVRKYSN